MDRPKYYIYSTTANPLHSHHIAIYEYLKERAKEEDRVVFEISEANATKRNVPPAEIRAEKLNSLCLPYIITSGVTFAEKLKLIRNETIKYSAHNIPQISWKYDIVFAVGADCYSQIFNKSHYCDSDKVMRDTFGFIKNNFGSFLVFERDGKSLYDTNNVPEELLEISSHADNFKSSNISSTQLRKRIGF